MKFKIELKDNVNLSPSMAEKTIKNFLQISSNELTSQIKKKTPVDYGKLRGSWTSKQSREQLRITNSRNYAVFVEKGTGIYGENGGLIFPKTANVLHANINGEDVFFKHSKGQKGKHMAEKGLEAYSIKIPNLFRTAYRQARGK